MKYYAVKVGRHPGIYESWEACQKEVTGYSGAVFKSFSTLKDAKAFLGQQEDLDAKKGLIAYVDGSFHAKKKVYGYGVVLIDGGRPIKQIYGQGSHPDYVGMRNVAGEIFGAEVAIEYAIAHQYEHIAVYYDYEGIEKWANGIWKANKKGTQEYVEKIKGYREVIAISFVKVLAHSGDRFNDEADHLAKKAVGLT